MSTNDRLDKWLTDSEEVLEAALEGDIDPEAFTDGRAGQALSALRAVLGVCDGLEEAHRANPEQTYEYGLEEAAHQVRNAVEAALGEVVR